MKKTSAALLVLAAFVLNTKSSATSISHLQDLSYNQMTGNMIERRIGELQDAIASQEEKGWTSTYIVTEKVDEVLDGIGHTFLSAREFDYVTRSQEGMFRKLSLTIWGRDKIRMMTLEREEAIGKLRDIFEPYHHPEWPYEDKVYSDKDRQDLLKLSSDLKASDLGRKNAIFKDDSQFSTAVETLHRLQGGEEGRAALPRVSP